MISEKLDAMRALAKVVVKGYWQGKHAKQVAIMGPKSSFTIRTRSAA